MPSYDFLILQPNEFEDLARDLLQKKDGIFIESFTTGRDGGIDLRYASDNGKNTIVQAKRYKSYPSLLAVLKKEVPKVEKIKPNRYVLVTSVELTPGNKNEIKEMFAPYIKDTSDILGRNDLNNLLNQFPDIEKQHHKLWLGSTAVLERILNKRIENWSQMELEETRKDISVFVMNGSFGDALDILKENRYVIISGIPGIGKTTLSRMLAYEILAGGYDEFIKISTMDDAAQKLADGKKQIFYYDDFLGSSFLEEKENGFEGKLLAFIEKVQREPDKLFILSTREYILRAAKHIYEKINLKNIEIAKCTLDISYYSEDIRAKILYNHLSVVEIPLDYLQELIEGKKYLKLIRHDNFNPRIIEFFLAQKLYLRESPEDFVKLFLDFFDHPFSVWKFAYDSMSDLAKCALCVRASMGSGYVFIDDWRRATEHYYYGITGGTMGYDDWHDVLKVLSGTFIITERSNKGELVRFNNPSVYDFLMDVIRQRSELQSNIIRLSCFTNQLYGTFTDKGYTNRPFGRIVIDVSLYDVLVASFNRLLKDLPSCKVIKFEDQIYSIGANYVSFIDEMLEAFPVLFRNRPEVLSGVITDELFLDRQVRLEYRMKLFDKIDSSIYGINVEGLVEALLPELAGTDDYVNVRPLLKKSVKGRALLSDPNYLEEVESAIQNELSSAADEYDINEIKDNIDSLSEFMPSLDANGWNSAADEALYQLNGPDEEPEYDNWDMGDRPSSHSITPSSDYYDLYSGLLDRE